MSRIAHIMAARKKRKGRRHHSRLAVSFSHFIPSRSLACAAYIQCQSSVLGRSSIERLFRDTPHDPGGSKSSQVSSRSLWCPKRIGTLQPFPHHAPGRGQVTYILCPQCCRDLPLPDWLHWEKQSSPAPGTTLGQYARIASF